MTKILCGRNKTANGSWRLTSRQVKNEQGRSMPALLFNWFRKDFLVDQFYSFIAGGIAASIGSFSQIGRQIHTGHIKNIF